MKESVFDADQFLDALERVAGGGTAMDPAVTARLFTATPPAARLGELTERERSVLALMAEGLSNAAIGRRLFLSDGAISKYTTSMFAKLGITGPHRQQPPRPRRPHLPRHALNLRGLP